MQGKNSSSHRKAACPRRSTPPHLRELESLPRRVPADDFDCFLIKSGGTNSSDALKESVIDVHQGGGEATHLSFPP